MNFEKVHMESGDDFKQIDTNLLKLTEYVIEVKKKQEDLLSQARIDWAKHELRTVMLPGDEEWQMMDDDDVWQMKKRKKDIWIMEKIS